MKTLPQPNQPVFIDFGPGKKFNNAANMRAQGAYTIGIDYHHREIHDTPEFQNAFDHIHYDDWSDRSRPDYVNRIRIDEWFTLVNRYMRISHCELQQKFDGDHPTSIRFNIGGVK